MAATVPHAPDTPGPSGVVEIGGPAGPPREGPGPGVSGASGIVTGMAGWDTVLTVLLSSGSALGGVALTHRYTARRWRDERADDRRLEQRDAAVALLDAGRVWASSATATQMGIIGLRGDLIALAGDTEIADRHTEPLREMRRATVAARLTIVEPSVAKAVRDVSWVLEAASKVMENITREAKRFPGGPSEEAGKLMFRFEAAAEHALDELERVALEAFSAAPEPRRRRRVRWPWSRRRRTAAEGDESAPPFAPELADAARHPDEHAA